MFAFCVSTIITSLKRNNKTTGVSEMATFYCVGFPDLAHTWARSGQESNHEIFFTEDEAKKANEGLITCVHEFYVRDSMFVSTIERLNIQRANFLANARS